MKLLFLSIQIQRQKSTKSKYGAAESEAFPSLLSPCFVSERTVYYKTIMTSFILFLEAALRIEHRLLTNVHGIASISGREGHLFKFACCCGDLLQHTGRQL